MRFFCHLPLVYVVHYLGFLDQLLRNQRCFLIECVWLEVRFQNIVLKFLLTFPLQSLNLYRVICSQSVLLNLHWQFNFFLLHQIFFYRILSVGSTYCGIVIPLLRIKNFCIMLVTYSKPFFVVLFQVYSFVRVVFVNLLNLFNAGLILLNNLPRSVIELFWLRVQIRLLNLFLPLKLLITSILSAFNWFLVAYAFIFNIVFDGLQMQICCNSFFLTLDH